MPNALIWNRQRHTEDSTRPYFVGLAYIVNMHACVIDTAVENLNAAVPKRKRISRHFILRSYSRRSCSSSINPRCFSALQAHTPFDRGVAAVEAMMSGLKDFYNDHSTLHNMMNRHLNCINPLLSTLPRSSRTFIRAALQRWRFLSFTIQD